MAPRRLVTKPLEDVQEPSEPPEAAVDNELAASLSEHWGVKLAPRVVQLLGGVTARFSLVSEDESIIGDSGLLNGTLSPMASSCYISERVWLLQSLARTASRFLAFRERRIPTVWLSQFMPLSRGVEFFYVEGQYVIDLKESI